MKGNNMSKEYKLFTSAMVSQTTGFRLYSNSPLTAKDIDKVISILGFQKQILNNTTENKVVSIKPQIDKKPTPVAKKQTKAFDKKNLRQRKRFVRKNYQGILKFISHHKSVKIDTLMSYINYNGLGITRDQLIKSLCTYADPKQGINYLERVGYGEYKITPLGMDLVEQYKNCA